MYKFLPDSLEVSGDPRDGPVQLVATPLRKPGTPVDGSSGGSHPDPDPFEGSAGSAPIYNGSTGRSAGGSVTPEQASPEVSRRFVGTGGLDRTDAVLGLGRDQVCLFEGLRS